VTRVIKELLLPYLHLQTRKTSPTTTPFSITHILTIMDATKIQLNNALVESCSKGLCAKDRVPLKCHCQCISWSIKEMNSSCEREAGRDVGCLSEAPCKKVKADSHSLMASSQDCNPKFALDGSEERTRIMCCSALHKQSVGFFSFQICAVLMMQGLLYPGCHLDMRASPQDTHQRRDHLSKSKSTCGLPVPFPAIR
jgi:hypothetical protein